MNKEIILIDAFITNKIDEQKLIDFIRKIKDTNLPILLISNSIIDRQIIEMIDFYIYDKKNRLFDYNFGSYDKFILWEIIDGIKFNTHYDHKQVHGLSVMINLFSCLTFIKSFGFEYFHRIEYDTELGTETIHKISNISNLISEEGKKGYFILDFEHKTHTFQYFYSEIDLFLNSIPNIRQQMDYVHFINNFYKHNEFVTVEKLMFDQLINLKNIKIIERKNWEFYDSTWNTTSSMAHLEENHKKCRTNFYHGLDSNVIFTKNNEDSKNKRVFFLYSEDKLLDKIVHELEKIHDVKYNYIEKKITKIEIYNDEVLCDIIEPHKEINFIEF